MKSKEKGLNTYSTIVLAALFLFKLTCTFGRSGNLGKYQLLYREEWLMAILLLVISLLSFVKNPRIPGFSIQPTWKKALDYGIPVLGVFYPLYTIVSTFFF
ncbi:MAG: hypothetical protein Q4Q07_09180 [Tissierellia bacterium]|nr:hypothetical protein [Tissierellia bacterium]